MKQISEETFDEYEKWIVGKWRTEDNEAIFEFKPVPKRLADGIVIVHNIVDRKTSERSYSIWFNIIEGYQLTLNFGLDKIDHTIRYLSDTMLIMHVKGRPETEGILYREP